MLSEKGKLIGDFTMSCLDEETFQLTASYGSQAYHFRWFLSHLQDDVHVENISNRRTGFQIAGPEARDVLQACTRTDVSDMRFLNVREMTIGQVACIVQRVSYTGDLGFEIYCDAMDQRALWSVLWEAGQPHNITPFGMRAMMSLRLDRFFGSWMAEFSPDYTAAETGLDRFISFKKNTTFIGRATAEAERATPPNANWSPLLSTQTMPTCMAMNLSGLMARSWAFAPPAATATTRKPLWHRAFFHGTGSKRAFRSKSKFSARCAPQKSSPHRSSTPKPPECAADVPGRIR